MIRVMIRQWCTTNWRFQVWLKNTLNNNTIRCKKLATIVSGRKYFTRLFVRWKQLSTSVEIYIAVIFRFYYIQTIMIRAFQYKNFTISTFVSHKYFFFFFFCFIRTVQSQSMKWNSLKVSSESALNFLTVCLWEKETIFQSVRSKYLFLKCVFVKEQMPGATRLNFFATSFSLEEN